MGRLINWHNYANTESWAGGVSDGVNGVASLFESMNGVTGSPLKAKKSGFFLGDTIVTLSAGINSSDANNQAETAVLNRKLNANGQQTFLVDEQEISAAQTLQNPRWALLTGSDSSSNLGVSFLSDASVNAQKQSGTGSW
ncbi:hypothetical protein KIMH_03800 [Bombiscardovia apis]|uniref:Polysaccharide lyase family 8 central domain-containing protein n=2 Tax=Bombiscardovia apis TaxID=2932182 RepID=A0ABM8BBH1_9BIFI|nr:hypothetical protein KIMH_03800 [Bombiscardovia apis]